MTFPSLLLALIATFVTAKVFGETAQRLHQPAVLERPDPQKPV